MRLLDGVLITGFGITAALTKIGARRPTRPQYSSPDAPSDVYSLGTIAFEAVAGKRVSPDNLADFEQRHGMELRGAFGVALAANPQMRPDRAGDFAAVLRDAADMTAEAEINSVAVGGVQDVAAPLAAAPVAAPAPAAAADVEADFDVPIDRAQEMVEPAVIGAQPQDDPMDRLATVDLPPPSAPRWSPAPARSFSPDLSGEPTTRRWPMVAMLLAFVILAGLSVAFFLRSPVASSSDQAGNAVDETIVDLPKSAPPASTAAPASDKKPQPALEPARSPSPPAAAPSRPASGAVGRSQTGNLLLRTTPADAEVTVNGQSRGKTPLVLRDLALGSYTIRVARDGFASEERTLQLTTRRPTFSTTINLRPAAASAAGRSTSAFAQGASADKPADRPASTGGANTIARGGSAGSAAGAAEKSTGGLNVQSRPPGARVFVNDRPAGSTPVAVPGVPAGSATVRIEMDGYEPWIATVNVNAGEQTRVGASLDRK